MSCCKHSRDLIDSGRSVESPSIAVGATSVDRRCACYAAALASISFSMGRNYLKGREGVRINAILAAPGCNFASSCTGWQSFCVPSSSHSPKPNCPLRRSNNPSGQILHRPLPRVVIPGLHCPLNVAAGNKDGSRLQIAPMDITRIVTSQDNPPGSVFDSRSMLRENLKYISVRDRPERLYKISSRNAANNSEGPHVCIKTKFAVQPVGKAPIVPSWVLLIPRKVDVWAHLHLRESREPPGVAGCLHRLGLLSGT